MKLGTCLALGIVFGSGPAYAEDLENSSSCELLGFKSAYAESTPAFQPNGNARMPELGRLITFPVTPKSFERKSNRFLIEGASEDGVQFEMEVLAAHVVLEGELCHQNLSRRHLKRCVDRDARIVAGQRGSNSDLCAFDE